MSALFDPPTRDQLARIAQGDLRLLKALELLFQSSGQQIPDDISTLETAPNNGLRALAGQKTKQDSIAAIESGQIVFVSDMYDFPAAVSGVITLEANTIYTVTCDVDLLGARLVIPTNVVIEGWGPSVSFLSSTGLTGTALLTSSFGITLRHIDISADVALDLNGSAGQFMDWLTVNFTDCPTVGTIQNYDNTIFINIGLINSANLTFDGSIGTVAFDNSLLSGRTGEKTIIIPATMTFTRRLRINFCAFVTPTGGTGIDFSTSAVVPVENYILFECNFGGAGAAIAGVTSTDNKALFSGNIGVTDTAEISNYYMTANATATTIAIVNTPVKAAGTTTSGAITQKFSNATTNRAEYTAAVTRTFEVDARLSCTSGNNNVLACYVAKNGTVQTQSVGRGTANAGGRAEHLSALGVFELTTTDYVEVWVENQTGANAITVEDLHVLVTEI